MNIYPFFSDGYDSSRPTDILDGLWDEMAAKFPASSSCSQRQDSRPLANLRHCHRTFSQRSMSLSTTSRRWPIGCLRVTRIRSSSGLTPLIADRMTTPYGEFEEHFGLYTYNRTAKAGYPLPGDEWDDGTDNVLESSSDSSLAASLSSSSSSSLFSSLSSTGSGSSCAVEGDNCESDHDGAQCCESGTYCQSWNSWYYQCRAAPAQCDVEEMNVVYYGDDFSKVYGILPEACCAKCAKTAGCTAYTYINYNYDGRSICHLKSDTGAKQESVGAVSAVVEQTV